MGRVHEVQERPRKPQHWASGQCACDDKVERPILHDSISLDRDRHEDRAGSAVLPKVDIVPALVAHDPHRARAVKAKEHVRVDCV
jgi:hypothetical protein